VQVRALPAAQLRVSVSVLPIVSQRFPFLHGDEAGTGLRLELSFLVERPRLPDAAHALVTYGDRSPRTMRDPPVRTSGG